MELSRPVHGRHTSTIGLSIALSLVFGLFGFRATAQAPSTTLIVGNGNDFFVASQNPISSATGSFDSVAGVMSVAAGPQGAQTADLFSLQINTNRFEVAVCQNRPPNSPRGCAGWQQFVFSNKNYTGSCGTPQNPSSPQNPISCVYIQYWLLDYGDPCPQGFRHGGGSEIDCFQNGAQATVPDQTIANLGRMQLTGQVTAGGQDNVTLTVGNNPATSYPGAGAPDSILDLGQNRKWTQAEFNVFGGCCALEAVFNPSPSASSTIVVRLTISNGTSAAPLCLPPHPQSGATGETNSLFLASSCCPIGGSEPAIVFSESSSNRPRNPPACAGPSVTITASPNALLMGESTQLSWATPSSSATCETANGWTGSNPAVVLGTPEPISGVLSIKLPITNTSRPRRVFYSYAITCGNANGGATNFATVAADPPIPKIAVCNLVCFRSLYGDPAGQTQNPVKADILLERVDRAAVKLGPFIPFGDVLSKLRGPVLLLQSGTINSLQISKSREVTVTLLPGSTVIKLGNLGTNVRIAEAATEPAKHALVDSPVSAKLRIVGINFDDGTASGLLIAREESPEASGAK